MPFLILLALLVALFGVGTMFKFLFALSILTLIGPIGFIALIVIIVLICD